MKFVLLAFTAALISTFAATAEDKPANPKPETIRTGHFEKNNSGLKGERSFLILRDYDAFEKVFGTVPPLGKQKNNPVTKADFEKSVVVAVITRGPAVTSYGDVSGTSADGQFTLKYKSVTGPAGTATFASPLLVVVPKEGLKGTIFADDGAEVGQAK